MNRKGYIVLLILFFYASLIQGQTALDTVCYNGGPTHLATAYQYGLTYHWSVNGGQIIGKSDTNDVLVQWAPIPGLHKATLVIKDSRGCYSDTSEVWIYLRGFNTAKGKGPIEACKGSTVTLVSSLATDFVWGGGQRLPELSFVAKKDTTVMLIALNGACGNDTTYFPITTIDIPTCAISQIEDTVQLHAVRKLYFLGLASDYIDWYVNGALASQSNSVVINFDRTGEYEIIQIVRNGANCADTIKKTVYVDTKFTVFIPNAFTPNGDGVNDYFKFDGVGIEGFTAQIYNRWGEKVYEWTHTSGVEGWDGTNSGKESKMDAYMYKIMVQDPHGKSHFFQDYFSLVR